VVRRLSSRTSLRTKLIAAVFALVVIALAVISIVGAMFMRTYLIGQTDQTLQNGGLQHTALDAAAGSNGSAVELAQAGYAIWWLPSGGSLQQIAQPVAECRTCLRQLRHAWPRTQG
jgi:type II secretory pathway pseudopilin PulG